MWVKADIKGSAGGASEVKKDQSMPRNPSYGYTLLAWKNVTAVRASLGTSQNLSGLKPRKSQTECVNTDNSCKIKAV